MIAPPLSHKHLLMVEDDEPTRRAVLRLMSADGWSAVAAGSIAEGRHWLARRQFACALLDLGLPDGDGIELLRHARATCPTMPVLVLTSARAWSAIEAALRGGARGYLLKEDLVSRLGPALHELTQGGAPLSGQVARQVLDQSFAAQPPQEAKPSPPPNGDPPQPPLTQREREVLGHLEAGLSYSEIAQTGGVSLNTVRSHIRSLYDKLGVHSRGRAVQQGKGQRAPL